MSVHAYLLSMVPWLIQQDYFKVAKVVVSNIFLARTVHMPPQPTSDVRSYRIVEVIEESLLLRTCQ